MRRYIYPAPQQTSPGLCFDDQFAFRPTGSTAAAIIALSHTLRAMLSSDLHVHILSFDFAKAFDTVRHESLMNKMAQLQLPDNIYNWIKNYFDEHYHCTRLRRKMFSCCRSEGQCDSRFWAGPSLVHCYGSSNARKPYLQICR